MDVRVFPGALRGTVPAIASKSVAHRHIIAAAFADAPTHVICNTTCDDIEATARCLEALGATIEAVSDGFMVQPLAAKATYAPVLDCQESGSTFRFLLPVACALGADAEFRGAARLAERPIAPLTDELFCAGCEFVGLGTFPLFTKGELRPGVFELPGNVSSQFVTGLLLAAPLMGKPSTVRVHGTIESKPYVDVTLAVLRQYGVDVHVDVAHDGEEKITSFTVEGSGYHTPGEVVVEGDWSNAAFWLCAGAIGSEPLSVSGLNLASPQGDRTILAALSRFGARITRTTSSATVHSEALTGFEMSARDIPDLVPIIAVVCALAHGRSVIHDCARLRMKESDRLETVCATLKRLGAAIAIEGDSLVIDGKDELAGGTVDACNDHRIAMMSAIAATRCANPVEIIGAEAVNKSYPSFFNDFCLLGGRVEKEGV